MTNHHFTLDLDWCSDDILEYVSNLLHQSQKKATWFATHKSQKVNELSKKHNFEIGIHPNFLKLSSHGSSYSTVLEHITGLFPHSKVMRSHALHQSSPILHEAASMFGIEIDVSLLLPYHPNLKILDPMGFGGRKIRRVPYFWEDDIEMLNGYTHFNFKDRKHHCDGIKTYDFHPVHVALNISSFDDYLILKEKKPVPQWDRKFILKYQKSGKGTLSFFEDMLEYIQGEMTMTELVERKQ